MKNPKRRGLSKAQRWSLVLLPKVSRYERAYREANGKEVEVTYSRGWFHVGGSIARVRAAELDRISEELESRVN